MWEHEDQFVSKSGIFYNKRSDVDKRKKIHLILNMGEKFKLSRSALILECLLFGLKNRGLLILLLILKSSQDAGHRHRRNVREKTMVFKPEK